MGTVVFAGVGAPLVSSLRKNATLAEDHFEEVEDAELALERLGNSNAEIDAMVIGPGVAEAMVLAQRAHARDRDVAVLLLAARGRSAEVAAELRYAPYLGPQVSFCEPAPDEVVVSALFSAVQRTRQRRGYRAALIPWRRKFAQEPGRPPRPEAVLERLLGQLPLGVLLLDAEGVVSSFNRRAAEFLVKGEREITGARVTDLVPPRVAPALDRIIASSAGEESLPAVTFELERPSGPSMLELTVASVVSPSSENGLLVLIKDVTERERAAREKEQLRAEIESSQRLASLGTLAAGVGHEINNPLTYVMGNVQYVLERLSEEGSGDARRTKQLGDLLRDALEGASRIRSIVRDLRTFSRLDSQEHGTVVIAEVVDSALSIVSNELRHRARVDRSYGAVDPVRGDSARLGQVFLNLFTNAAQAIRDGQAGSNLIRITIEKGPPGFLVVGIRDTGEGIPEEVMGKIFDPFFTTKPVGQGTGLGLAICQRIVAEHSGSISVESQPGQGAVFRVTLPTIPSKLARETKVELEVAETRARRANILAVDDEPAVGRVVQLVLGEQHDVTVVRSGEAAVAKIQAGERFDVILCDVMMPTMAGPEVHERILGIDALQATRIVFMSGGVFSHEARAYLERLPNRLLEKPFRAEQLRKLVEELRSSDERATP